MIFTYADPRYAGRSGDKQVGDTIVTIERVREAVSFNAGLADVSAWLLLLKGSKFMHRNLQWEAPSMPTAAHDPRLLPEQETPLVIEKNWFLDQQIPAGGFVRM